MGAVQRLSSEAQLAMTAKNGLISLVFVALYLCISCQPCQGDDDQQAKDLFKRETRKSFLSYFWPSYNRRAAEEPYWWYYNKRAPGSEFLGKRAPGSEFLGKRVPGSEFLGKRVPGSEFLGKRAPGSEFLGKRGHQLDYAHNVMQEANHPKGSLEVPLMPLQKNERTRFEKHTNDIMY